MGRFADVEIRIPQEKPLPPEAAQIGLIGEDGRPEEVFEAGESLTVTARGLRPVTAYDVAVLSESRELFSSRLITNAPGEIEPTVLWPQSGMDDRSSGARPMYEEGRWQ